MYSKSGASFRRKLSIFYFFSSEIHDSQLFEEKSREAAPLWFFPSTFFLRAISLHKMWRILTETIHNIISVSSWYWTVEKKYPLPTLREKIFKPFFVWKFMCYIIRIQYPKCYQNCGSGGNFYNTHSHARIVDRMFYLLLGNLTYELLKSSPGYQKTVVKFLAMAICSRSFWLPRFLSHFETHKWLRPQSPSLT